MKMYIFLFLLVGGLAEEINVLHRRLLTVYRL